MGALATRPRASARHPAAPAAPQGSTALALTVARQTGNVALPDNDQWTDRLQIRSETSSRLYVVARNKRTGSYGCSCPGWKSHRTCKHLTAMVPLLQRAEQRAAAFQQERG